MRTPHDDRFSVYIEKADTRERYEEYQTTCNTETTECHIESSAGQSFVISGELNGGRADTTCETYTLDCFIDGHFVVGKILGVSLSQVYYNIIVRGQRISLDEFRPFIFVNTQFSGILNLSGLLMP
jgi:hypothetical protein